MNYKRNEQRQRGLTFDSLKYLASLPNTLFLVIKQSFCLKQIPLASSYPSKRLFIFSLERKSNLHSHLQRPFPEIEAENLGSAAYARQKWSPTACIRNSKPPASPRVPPLCPPLLPHHSPFLSTPTSLSPTRFASPRRVRPR